MVIQCFRCMCACLPGFYFYELSDGTNRSDEAWCVLRSFSFQLYHKISFLLLQLAASGISDEQRKAQMNSVNPKYVLRNYLCQTAIDAAEQGDYTEVRRLLKLMERPYDEQPGMEKYARLPPAWAYRPGVCMLSCSSWVAWSYWK